ncbi:NUDIX hydrolase [Paenibacillus thalictri]|uniref:NUDIX domain-containing protein n=1 Tax=Paenibacillus thalictri TaxID=2527873 RepID=A0A4Q9DSZ9_9BACL|nr:NUDIX domain-containing protein [Paenibacillus thalictri]TBL80009.1 NUDIX domain-containing protein [Paenibacillus thalictri]
MRLIRTITDGDFDGGVPVLLDFTSRQASRGVLLDDKGNVGMMSMAAIGLYKLPGGGIEAGESKEAAFLREIKEETGFDARIVHELGVIEEHKFRNDFMQLSYCFISQTCGAGTDAQLSESEIELGMHVTWMGLHEAIEQMRISAQRCGDYSDHFMLLRDHIILEETADWLTGNNL